MDMRTCVCVCCTCHLSVLLWVDSLFPSQATILTLSTFTSSVTSLNSTSFRTNVHTLSQNLYVFRDPWEVETETEAGLDDFFLGGGAWENTDGLTLKLTLLRTRLASAVLMALSNWRRTWRASWGVICWVWTHTHTFISLNLRFLNNKQLKEMVGTRDHCSKTQSQVNIRRRNHWIYFTCTGANEMRWTWGQQQDNTHKQECCNSWWHTEQKQRITFVCVVTLLILYPVPKIIAQQTGGCAATIW